MFPHLKFNTISNAVPGIEDDSLLHFELSLATSTQRFTGQGYTADVSGATRTVAILLAIDDINNKMDGIYDTMLPHTPIWYNWKPTGRHKITGDGINIGIAKG